jgi:ABC-2 type transport system permease protein
MPIHDQSYRRYGGARSRPGSGWSVITLAGIRTMLGRRRFLVLLLVAWLPCLVRGVQIYLAANFPQASILELSAETYREFLEQQGLFLFFITIYVGAGLIASDRRAHALQLYLSKPLSRAEYVIGKLGVLMAFLLLVTWAPAMTLLLLQVLFEGSFEFLRTNMFVVPAITLFALIEVLLASFTMLALSSLSTSPRYVGVLYAGAVLFTDTIYGVLHVAFGGTRLAWISFQANLALLGDVVFRQPPRYDVPWAVSLIVVVGLIAVSISVLEKRVRGIEVVT